MSSRFPDQPGDHEALIRDIPPHDLVEVSDTTVAPSDGSGESPPGVEKKSDASRSPLWSALQTVASQDYFGVLVAMVVLVLGISVLHPNFLAISQLLDILSQATFVAVLACGMAVLLSMRELDL